MLYSELQERQNRFKLALRMGLPLFLLAIISISSMLITYFSKIPSNFIIASVALLAIMIYYLFYLIYQGFSERITDPVTKAFSREYFTKYIDSKIKKKLYTVVLFSIDNLQEINSQYGFLNGDIVLRKSVKLLNEYFSEKIAQQVSIVHFKGGDFIVVIEGSKELYRSTIELMFIKFKEISIDEIEINISGAMSDTTHIDSFEMAAQRLFELQLEDRDMFDDDEIDLSRLDTMVIKAVEDRSFSYRYQVVFRDSERYICELSIKLIIEDGKLIHQKRFMPIVSKLGLLRSFDEATVNHAIDLIPTLKSEIVAVTISPSTLRSNLFLEKMIILFSNNETLKNRLLFIISEYSYFYNIEHFNNQIQAYRRAGIKIAIDRVGGLHSSFRYFSEIDVDVIRFETHFTKELSSNKIQAVLKGITNSAKILKTKSWIRLIENQEQLDIVKSIDIDLIQGNFLAPIDTFKDKGRE